MAKNGAAWEGDGDAMSGTPNDEGASSGVGAGPRDDEEERRRHERPPLSSSSSDLLDPEPEETTAGESAASATASLTNSEGCFTTISNVIDGADVEGGGQTLVPAAKSSFEYADAIDVALPLGRTSSSPASGLASSDGGSRVGRDLGSYRSYYDMQRRGPFVSGTEFRQDVLLRHHDSYEDERAIVPYEQPGDHESGLGADSSLSSITNEFVLKFVTRASASKGGSSPRSRSTKELSSSAPSSKRLAVFGPERRLNLPVLGSPWFVSRVQLQPRCHVPKIRIHERRPEPEHRPGRQMNLEQYPEQRPDPDLESPPIQEIARPPLEVLISPNWHLNDLSDPTPSISPSVISSQFSEFFTNELRERYRRNVRRSYGRRCLPLLDFSRPKVVAIAVLSLTFLVVTIAVSVAVSIGRGTNPGPREGEAAAIVALDPDDRLPERGDGLPQLCCVDRYNGLDGKGHEHQNEHDLYHSHDASADSQGGQKAHIETESIHEETESRPGLTDIHAHINEDVQLGSAESDDAYIHTLVHSSSGGADLPQTWSTSPPSAGSDAGVEEGFGGAFVDPTMPGQVSEFPQESISFAMDHVQVLQVGEGAGGFSESTSLTERPTEPPATRAPVTRAPVTGSPVTGAPTTGSPVTRAPVTSSPIVSAQSMTPPTPPPTNEPTREPTKEVANPNVVPLPPPTTPEPSVDPSARPSAEPSSPPTPRPTKTPTRTPTKRPTSPPTYPPFPEPGSILITPKSSLVSIKSVDATIDASKPDRNYGSDPHLHVEGLSKVALLKFDVGPLRDYSVSKATLILYSVAGDEYVISRGIDFGGPSRVRVDVLPAAGDWREGAATWDRGVSSVGSYRAASFDVHEFRSEMEGRNRHKVDVTRSIDAAISKKAGTTYLTFELSTEPGESVVFASREWNEGAAQPELVVLLAQPTDSPTPEPSDIPTQIPTVSSSPPTGSPVNLPTESPLYLPTAGPSLSPTTGPAKNPTAAPTAAPSPSPSASPAHPSLAPTETPTTKSPTVVPTVEPTSSAPVSMPPSTSPVQPTSTPSSKPTGSPEAPVTTIATSSPTTKPTTVVFLACPTECQPTAAMMCSRGTYTSTIASGIRKWVYQCQLSSCTLVPFPTGGGGWVLVGYCNAPPATSAPSPKPSPSPTIGPSTKLPDPTQPPVSSSPSRSPTSPVRIEPSI
ncbi:hypothetical protein ACHAWF_010344 [Thalassiosira exigua]